jgi:hypothetical protein
VTAHPDCPHCTCRWHDDIPVTIVDKDAPGYPLVLACLAAERGEEE